MKKLLLLLAFAPLFFSCSKGSGGADTSGKDSRYKIQLAFTANDPETKYDVTIYEYNDKNEKMGQNLMTGSKKDASASFKANPLSVKLKIYVKYYSPTSTYYYAWVQQVFYLNLGKETSITITSSMLGKNEP